jgi:hypothetical protein
MRKLILIAGFVGCIVLMHLLPLSFFHSDILNSEFENLLHSVGFAGVTIVAFYYLNRFREKSPFVLVFISLISLGILAELVQLLFSRDASLLDLLRDAGGIISALLFIASWKTKSRLLIPAASIITIVFMTPFLIAGGAILSRNASETRLFTFERWWEKKFTEAGEGTILSFVKPPDLWKSNTSPLAAELSMRSGTYPGISFTEILPDWSGSKVLRLSIFSFMEKTIPISIRIHDRHHNNDYNDRFNTTFQIGRGINEISIPISSIRKGPRKRQLDMKQIEAIVIFTEEQFTPSTIYLDNIILEK